MKRLVPSDAEVVVCRPSSSWEYVVMPPSTAAPRWVASEAVACNALAEFLCGSVARLSGSIVGWVVVSATSPPLSILGVTTQIVEIYLEVDANVYIPRIA